MKLTPTQHDILAKAVERPDGLIVEPMTTSVRKALIALGLAAAEGDGLTVTEPGRRVIFPLGVPPPPAPSTPVIAAPPTGKLAAIVALLHRPAGASLLELQEATGWQAHSVRGALAGALKRRFHLAVESHRTDAGRSYRIAPPVDGDLSNVTTGV